jgi:hypothetical protein
MKKRMFVYAVWLVFLFSCTSDRKNPTIYESGNCVLGVSKISFIDLVDSMAFYNNKVIETSGYYHSGMEKTALSQSRQHKEPAIWIEFDPGLSRNVGDSSIFLEKTVSEFNKIDKKRIVVQGIIDTGSHGHLGQYIATLKDVCYLKVLD